MSSPAQAAGGAGGAGQGGTPIEFASTWLFERMNSSVMFGSLLATRQPSVPAVIAKCPTETPQSTGRGKDAVMSPTAMTSVGTPSTEDGTCFAGGTSFIGSFVRT